MEKANKSNKYIAFISYSSEEKSWAEWFQQELQNYQLPEKLRHRLDLPQEFRSVFRDVNNLKAGNISKQLHESLASSEYLIVMCSPKSAQSYWVNKEVNDFIEIGKAKGVDNINNILPFIIDGHPHAKNVAEECLPTAMLNLLKEHEILGISVSENGRDKAFVQVVSGMLPSVPFDELWNQYEVDKAKKERDELEKKNNLLRLQSRFVAEKALSMAKEDSYLARLLAVEVLPENLDKPSRPYTAEAEQALRKSCSYNSAIIRNHNEHVTAASYSPNGEFIVSSAWDKTIKISNAKTGKEIKAWAGDSRCVKSAAFSPDGKRVISASGKDVVKIWDIDTEQEVLTLRGHQGRVNTAMYSPNGKYIVTTSMDNRVIIWNASTGKLYRSFIEHKDFVFCAAFSPDSRRIVSSSNDGVIFVWNVSDGKIIHSLSGHKGYVCSVTFSPDGLFIVSTSIDRTAKIWNAITGKLVRTLVGHESVVSCATFDESGNRIVTASWDRTLRFWNVSTGEEQLKLTGHMDNKKVHDWSHKST